MELEVKGLTVEKGGRRILEVEELSVRSGEVLGVVGPNGAGKTTLLLALAGLESSFTGQILVDGVPLVPRHLLRHRRRIGVVFQDPQVLDTTVLANAMLPLRYRGVPPAEARQRAGLWLDRLGIAHLAGRRARSLSGGERQRLALARALAVDPCLLLLDEPFSSVDASTKAALVEDLSELFRSYGRTVVLVSHEFSEVFLLAHRVAVLKEGRVRQVGTPAQVFSHPGDAEVAKLVGMENVWPGQVMTPSRVRLDGGVELDLPRPHPLGRVLVGVRPEALRLFPCSCSPLPGGEVDNRFPARLRAVWSCGPLVRVELEAGIPLVALLPPAEAVLFRPGEQVLVGIPPAAIHLLESAP